MSEKRNFICLAGIDGSGKSTVAEHLIKTTDLHFHYIWARWEPFLLAPFIMFLNKRTKGTSAKLDEDTQHNKKQRLKNKLLRFSFIKNLWLILAEYDYFLQLLKKILLPYLLHRNIICDRYIYDFYVDQMINLREDASLLNKYISKRILRVFPKPDLLLYITISAKTGNARKKDGTSVPYLAQRKTFYDQLPNIYTTIEINGETELQMVLKTATKALKKYLK